MAKIIARKIAKERKGGKKVDDESLTEIYLEGMFKLKWFIRFLLKNDTLCNLGQEKSEFWSAIGGKGPYTDICEFKVNNNADFVPRLFHGSNASGFFRSNYNYLNDSKSFPSQPLISSGGNFELQPSRSRP